MSFCRDLYTLLQFWILISTQQFGSRCQTEFCGVRQPVIKICTDDVLTFLSSVNIDTADVPKYRKSSCLCTISPVHTGVEFIFRLHSSNKSDVENMQFEINDVLLNSSHHKGRTTVQGSSNLVFSTTDDFTTERVCLFVLTVRRQSYSEYNSKFNITCSEPVARLTKSNQHPPIGSDETVTIAVSAVGGLLLIAGSIILLLIVYKYRAAKETNRNRSDQHPVSPLSDDFASENQRQKKYMSEAEHYLAMSYKHPNIRHDGETYEMSNTGPAHSQKQVGVLGKGQGQQTKDYCTSHIYESMHIRLDSVRQSGRTKDSTNDVLGKGSSVNKANVGMAKSAHYYNLTENILKTV